MPTISKDVFLELRKAGNRMSNVCFNLSQLTADDQSVILREAYQAWDAAKEDVRVELSKREERKLKHRKGKIKGE